MAEQIGNYQIIEKEGGLFAFEYVNGFGAKKSVEGAYSEIYPLDSKSALIVKDANGKWNLLRGGQVEFVEPADLMFVDKDGVFIFADLDENGIVKRDSTLMSYDEVWDNLQLAKLSDHCGPKPENYGHTLDAEKKIYIDSEGNCVYVEKVETLQKLFEEPSSFLTLKTEDFKEENFVRAATVAVKNGIKADIEKQEEVSDEYVSLTQDLISSVKEKTEKEFAKIEEMRLQEENAKQQNDDKKKSVEKLLERL